MNVAYLCPMISTRFARILSSMLVYVSFVAGAAWAYTDSMTDQDFFGVWNGSTWTTAPKVNYDFGADANLAAARTYAQAGNYTAAKTSLLAYYSNRSTTAHSLPALTSSDPAVLAQAHYFSSLLQDNILFTGGDVPQGDITVTSSYATYTIDVTAAVKAAVSNGLPNITFYLMGRNKDDTKYAIFNSRETGANVPSLSITVGGSMTTNPASQDTYTSAGAPTANYGTISSLYVQDSGIAANSVYDNNSRRAYIQFSLAGYSTTTTVSSATISVYGKIAAGTGTMPVMLVSTDVSISETALTWSNQKANVFSWNGLSTPDWNQPALGANNEYSWLISRFQFLGPLMQAYNDTTTTGNDVHAATAIRLIRQFIQASHPDASIAGLFYQYTYDYPRSLEVGFRTYLWPRCLQYLCKAAPMTGDDFAGIIKSLWQSADWQSYGAHGQGGGNWLAIETTGLYTMAVYYPELTDPTGSWKPVADNRLAQVVGSLIRLDGSYVEGSYNYTGVTLASLMNTKTIADLNGQVLTTSYVNGIKKLATFVMDETLPNGFDPVYGDGHDSPPLGTLTTVANAFNMPDLLYVATVGASGSAPSHLSAFYPDGLTVTMRTGWTPTDKYMLFTNSAGTHSHEDQNEVILYAHGKVLLCDTGVNSYLASDPIGYWQFANAESHNTIKINQLHQDKYNGAMSTNTDTMSVAAANSGFDFAEGTTYASPGFAHTRDVLFIRPNYWVVSDLVTGGGGTNTFEQNWHTKPGAAPSMDGVTKSVVSNFGAGNPNIQIVPADPTALTSAGLYDGYYEHTVSYNEKFAKYAKTTSGNVTFDAVLYPLMSGQTGTATITRLPISPPTTNDVATAIRIDLGATGANAVGRYYLSHENLPVTVRGFDGFDYDGKLAYVEKNSANALTSVAIAQGRTLHEGQKVLVQSTETIGDLSVRWSGATLDLSGGNLILDTGAATAIAVWAPAATAVTVNGNSAPFSRVGDFVYAVRTGTGRARGREDFSSVQGAGGWTYEKESGGVYAPLVYSSGSLGTATTGSDEFGSSTLGSQWFWAGGSENSATWSLTAVPGKMEIRGENGDIWSTNNNQKNLLVQQPAFPDYQLETKLSFPNTTNYQGAGLIVYCDADNFIKLERGFNDGKFIRLVREFTDYANNNTLIKDNGSGTQVSDAISGDIYLRLIKRGLAMSAYYSSNGTTWTQLGSTFNVPSIIERATVGLQAMNTNSGVTANGDFDYFHITQVLPANWSTSGSTAAITPSYTLTGPENMVRKWTAPASGNAIVFGKVSSHVARPGGDGVKVRVLKNDVPIWPGAANGWQTIGNTDVTGATFNLAVSVAQGDRLSFVTNQNANSNFDAAEWAIDIQAAPDSSLKISDLNSTATAAALVNWTPLTPSRWSIGANGGSATSYYINTGGYAPQSGGRPGELSIRNDVLPDRFRLTLTARVADPVATTSDANGVVILNYQDPNNYYFFEFNNTAAACQLWRVSAGVASIIADANILVDWIADNNYHAIAVDRDAIGGGITVYFDGVVMLRANDTTYRGGTIGVGSMNRRADFSSIAVNALPARADTFAGSTIDPSWSWIRPNPSLWSLSAVPGSLRITASSGDLWFANNNETNIALRTTPYSDFSLKTLLTFGPNNKSYQSAGLIAYLDDDNYVKVDRNYNGGNRFRMVKEAGGAGVESWITDPISIATPVYLKLTKSGDLYSGYYSTDNLTWSQIGSTVTLTAGPLPKVGLHAQKSGAASTDNVTADFASFEVTNNAPSISFNAATLDAAWSWYNAGASNWSLTSAPGQLKVTPDAGDIWGTDTTQKYILLQNPKYDDFTLVTKLTLSPTANYQAAGLIVFYDADNYIKVNRGYNAGNVYTMLKETAGVTAATTAADTLAGTPTVYLKLVKWGATYSGYYSADGISWNSIGSYSGVSFSSSSPMKVGLHAMRSGPAGPIDAYFGSFQQTGSNHSDDFGGVDLDPIWSWVREDKDNWSLQTTRGSMQITATNGDLWFANNNQSNLLLRPSPFGDFKIVTSLDFLPGVNYQSAGLIAYVDDDNYIKVDRAYNTSLGNNVLRLVKEAAGGGTQTVLAETTTGTSSTSPVYLMLAKSGTTYHGYYSTTGVAGPWTTIASAGYTASFSSTPLVGLHTQCSSGATSSLISAKFASFSVDENSGVGAYSVTSPTLTARAAANDESDAAQISRRGVRAFQLSVAADRWHLPSDAFLPGNYALLSRLSLLDNGSFEDVHDPEAGVPSASHLASWDSPSPAIQSLGTAILGNATAEVTGEGKESSLAQEVDIDGVILAESRNLVLGGWVKSDRQTSGSVYLRVVDIDDSAVIARTPTLNLSGPDWSYLWTRFVVPQAREAVRVELVADVNGEAVVQFDGIYLGPDVRSASLLPQPQKPPLGTK
jgi:regulation of enolase protein 1 (concanavalin A-like superfamily)